MRRFLSIAACALALLGAALPAAVAQTFTPGRDTLLTARHVSYEEAELWAEEFLSFQPSVASFERVEPGYIVVTTQSGTELDFYLDNLIRLLAVPRQEREPVLADFEANISELIASMDEPAEPGLDDLMPIVRRADMAELATDAAEDADAPQAGLSSRPLAGDVAVFLAVDMPTAIAFATPQSLNDLGVSEDEAFARALENFARFAEILDWIEEGGLRQAVLDANYESSLLLLGDVWTNLEAEMGGQIAVAIPARGLLVAARADSGEDVSALRAMAADATVNPYGLSSEVFVRRNGRWQVLE